MILLTTLPLLASLSGAAPAQDLCCAPSLGRSVSPYHHLTLSMGDNSWDRSVIGESNEVDTEWYSRGGESSYGLSYHNCQPGSVGVEFGIIQGNGDSDQTFSIFNGVDLESVPGSSHTESSEKYIGVLYVADTGSIRPYVGAGFTWIKAEADYSYAGGLPSLLTGGGSGSGKSKGYYLHTGVDLVLDGNMTLGLDYRMVMGTEDIEFYSEDDDLHFDGDGAGMDSSTFSITLGFGF